MQPRNHSFLISEDELLGLIENNDFGEAFLSIDESKYIYRHGEKQRKQKLISIESRRQFV